VKSTFLSVVEGMFECMIVVEQWRLRQPSPGVFQWRTPHGYWFRVDHRGTHPLGTETHPGQPPAPAESPAFDPERDENRDGEPGAVREQVPAGVEDWTSRLELDFARFIARHA
jgi:hypothetical protein